MPESTPTFLTRHSLSLASAAVVLLCLILYIASNPATHSGAFFGNAIADWAGVLATVLATKHLTERKERRKLPPGSRLSERLLHLVHNHSLTVFLVLTGIAWLALYLRMNVDSKWGQVAGSLVSEWTQTLGLVLMSKRFIERSTGHNSKTAAPGP